MKPPICEVCDDRFAPADGDLVSFLATPESRAFDERAEMPGFVGHAPNTGWFCPTHVDDARDRAGSMTLDEALEELTGRTITPPRLPEQHPVVDQPQPPPIPAVADAWPAAGRIGDGLAECATCSITFPDRAGGFVEFFEEYSVKVARSLSEGDARFERPSRRWFCSRHLGPAMLIRDSIGLDDARTLLMPEGREPLEYNESPPGVSIGSADEQGEPMRGPFLPMPDPSFDDADNDATETDIILNEHAITGRIADDIRTIVHSVKAELQEALGISHMRSTGSISAPSTDPVDLRLASDAPECSTTIGSSHGHDVAIFLVSARHLDGDRLVGQHVRLLVQKRERSILELVATAGPDAVIAADGRVLLDQIQVRVTPDVAPTLETTITRLLDELRAPAGDPFSRSPDLDGVDLRGGQIRRRTGDDSLIEWDLQPIALSTVRERFVELAATLFEELELGPVPELSVTTKRSWTPMDGAVEPNCPYVDYVRHEPTTGEIPPMVSISSDAAYWSDDDISNVSANLFVRVGGHRIAAFANGRGDHDACTSLSLFRPTTEAIVTALTGAFSDRLR